MGSGTMSSYGIIDSRWLMEFSRARRLQSDGTTYHGACLMSVSWNVVSFAIE